MSYYFQAIKRQRLSAIMTFLEGLAFPVCFIGLLAPFFGMKGVWAGVIAVEAVSAVIIILVLIVSKAWNRETSFLLPCRQDPDRYDYSISMNNSEAVNLSSEVHEWLNAALDPSIAMKTALALEEMLTGIVRVNKENDDTIDVVMRQENNEIVISIRDMGAGFNPTVEDESLKLEFDNIYVLQKIASEIKYDRSIGMNATLIRIAGRKDIH